MASQQPEAEPTAAPEKADILSQVGKVLMAGTLYKQSSFGMLSTKWCSLHTSYVIIYDDPEDKDKKPQLVMPLSEVQVAQDSNSKVFIIKYQGANHKYKCSSAEQCSKWMKTFDSVLVKTKGVVISPPQTPNKLPHSVSTPHLLCRTTSPSHSATGTSSVDVGDSLSNEGNVSDSAAEGADSLSTTPQLTLATVEKTPPLRDEELTRHSSFLHILDKRRHSTASEDSTTGMTPPSSSILSASVPAVTVMTPPTHLKRKSSTNTTSPMNSPVADAILVEHSRTPALNLNDSLGCTSTVIQGSSPSQAATVTVPVQSNKGTPPLLSMAPQPSEETASLPPVVFLPDPADNPDYYTQFVEYHTGFEEPDSDSNVMWLPQPDGKYSIRGGNIYKLVQYLTHPSENDLDFMQAFLISYHVFLTGPKLLDILAARFYMRRPVSMDFSSFTEVRRLVRLRVVSTLKYWTKLYSSGAFYDEEMITKMVELLNSLSTSCPAASNVLKSIQLLQKQKMSGELERQHEERVPPVIYLSAMAAPTSLLDVHPEELARQIMLMEWETFSHIHPKEFIKQAWNKPALKEKEAPNITRMIEETNKRTTWVLTEILSGETAPLRALIIHRFILATEASHQMRNYNAAMEISLALQDSAIHRLKASWKLVPASSMELFEKHCDLFATANNFTPYREMLKCSVPPCVPYLGVGLKDITFASDGNPSLIPSTELINFVKYRNCSKIIATLGQFQLERPPYTPLPEVQAWIIKQQSVALPNPDAAYDQSLLVESQKTPKESDIGPAAEKAAKSLFKADAKAVAKASLKAKKLGKL
ncbi:ras GEF [Pelomyxa schiedti]|nr:ras GEF [Pelomyxa schiedti]